MKDVNWNLFRSKFDKKESSMFEYLSYLLFCSEHENLIGLFRFKNQTGIETEPIEFNGKKIGFQAKFYDSKISDHKDDIVDSLKKAKRENLELDEVFLYINREISESSKKGTKRPQYFLDIERESKKLNIVLTWRVPSNIELQLSHDKNRHICDFFFSNEKSVIELLKSLDIRTNRLLFPIQTDIEFQGRKIKIDRSSSLERIRTSLAPGSTHLISGDGGCGKTAIIKELAVQLNKNVTPFYAFKGAEFNIASIDKIFSGNATFQLDDFISAHHGELDKMVLIDSAEKIADIENQEPFTEFISELVRNSWTLIFTTRSNYLDDLRYQLISLFRLKPKELNIGKLEDGQLEKVSNQHSFNLPINPKLRELIQIPLYLDEYLRGYNEDGKTPSYFEFKEEIWKRKIQKSSFTKNNTHLLREKCFLSIVQNRVNDRVFFVEANECSGSILSNLAHDEIIAFDAEAGGYFITHDIYEEWGLEVIINRAFSSSSNPIEFFSVIGNSLPVRRSLRTWLSDKLYSELKLIKPFIEHVFSNEGIEDFWRDEILTSVLLSRYSDQFIKQFESIILNEDKVLLKRIAFILRISCKELDHSILDILKLGDQVTDAYVLTKPKGNGWKSFIHLVFSNEKYFDLDLTHIVAPVLYDWTAHYRRGASTKQAGLIALRLYKEVESNEDLFYEEAIIQKLIDVIIQSSLEIIPDLRTMFDEVLGLRKVVRRHKYYNLCKTFVSSEISAYGLINAMPEYCLKFAKLYWLDSAPKRNQFHKMGTEGYFSLNDNPKYFPSSAFQTPLFWLLNIDYELAIDFIISFVNNTTVFYADSEFDKSIEEVQLTFESGEKVVQFHADTLWNMFRGTGSPVAPHLLQSIHMALEKYLLSIAEKNTVENFEDQLLDILRRSKSSSISGVVASVVLSQPDRLFEVAKVLFTSTSFILCDRVRSVSGEHRAKSLTNIGFSGERRNRHKLEREQTFEQKHRSTSLESIMLHYQFFKYSDTTDEEVLHRKEAIWKIIDLHYEKLSDKSKETDRDKTKRLLLARVDGRKMNLELEEKGDQMLLYFNPQISKDLIEHSESALADSAEFMKYTGLGLWAKSKFETNVSGDYSQYEDNPAAVLQETKELLDELENNHREEMQLFNRDIPGYTCAALIKEFKDDLSIIDLDFTRKVIESYVIAPFFEGYQAQISDGVEVSLHALPGLMEIYPESKNDYLYALLFYLFNQEPIGNYKRICDYSIEVITKLWVLDPTSAKMVLVAYGIYMPRFNEEIESQRKESAKTHGYPQFSQAEVNKKFDSKYEKDIREGFETNFNLAEIQIEALEIEDLEILFQLTPTQVYDKEIRDLVIDILPHFSSVLLMRNRDRNNYELQKRVFRKYASVVLFCDHKDVSGYAKSFVDNFNWSEEMGDLFEEFISGEIKIRSYENFWFFWDCFYSRIIEAGGSKSHHVSKVIHAYLLAWPWWSETTKSWESLKEREKLFYKRIVSDVGGFPSVFDSIAKVLNGVGSSFLNDGIFWISDMVVKNQDNQLEKNTIYYVEQAVRKYILMNRNFVRKNSTVNTKVMIILNFLIERGSVNSYLLREDII